MVALEPQSQLGQPIGENVPITTPFGFPPKVLAMGDRAAWRFF